MKESILRNLLVKYGLEGVLSSSYDLIGDIMIIRKLPHHKVSYENLVNLCDELLKNLRYIKTVYLDESGIREEYRLRAIKFLCGQEKTRTIYKESGLTFIVDVKNAYVSPRLSYEHLRIAKRAREGEIVINMFAGVGIFSIFLAKFSKAKAVYSIDLNPVAYELMLENIKLNKVENIVIPILGDSSEIVMQSLKGIADRILMPLPNLSGKFYCSAIYGIRKKGYLHAYEFVHVDKGETKKDALNKGYEAIKGILSSCDRPLNFSLELSRVVRSVGPRWIQGVYDIYLETLE